MPQVILFVMVVLGVFALVMWYMMQGRQPTMPAGRELSGMIDPLTLESISGLPVMHALVKLAVPTADYGQGVVELVVTKATKGRLLKYGPIAFAEGLSELAHSTGGQYYHGPFGRGSLDELREKLFGKDDVCERIRLIHNMTETDFVLLYEEDEDAVRVHFARCGFAPLNDGSATTSEHTLRM